MAPTDHEINEARATLDAFRADWREDTDLTFARVARHAVELATAVASLLAHVEQTADARQLGTEVAAILAERREIEPAARRIVDLAERVRLSE